MQETSSLPEQVKNFLKLTFQYLKEEHSSSKILFVIRVDVLFFSSPLPSFPSNFHSVFKIIVDQKIGRYSNLDWRFSGLNHPIVRFLA